VLVEIEVAIYKRKLTSNKYFKLNPDITVDEEDDNSSKNS